jgi:hypothetical protein
VTFTSSDPSPTSRAPSMGRHTVEDLEPGRNDRPGRAARGEDGDRRMEGRRKGRGNFNAAFATRLSRRRAVGQFDMPQFAAGWKRDSERRIMRSCQRSSRTAFGLEGTRIIPVATGGMCLRLRDYATHQCSALRQSARPK